jgi:hypothetical protein
MLSSSLLNSGVLNAVFQSSGTFPCSSDAWEMMLGKGDADVVIVFKNLEETLFGPLA